MRTRALPIMTAVWLGIAVIPLAGCDRDISGVHAEKDDKGKTRVRVDEKKVNENLDEAQKDLESAGRQIKEGVKKGAEDVGEALQRGAEKIEAEVGPVAQEVLNDAGITARIKAKLIADPEVAGLHIDVDTVDGRVTLNGKVASEDQRAEAEKLATRTDGVKEVVNLIQVAGKPSPPATPPAPRQR
jgi:hyperosmotically inducible periplasmic protein